MGLHGGVCVNRERHRYWAAYIADVQGRMKLGDWEVVLQRQTARAGAEASMGFFGSVRRGWMYLGKDFEKNSRTEQRITIVHELVHCHMHPLRSYLQVQLDSGGDDYNRHRDYVFITLGHDSHEEYIVEDLARIIAPSMPLPPKGAKS
jgi:hypothetical protein